jgi:menaquinone-9 beta-reductase
MYDLICIGGGLAGLTTSVILAKEGYKVAIIEKNDYPQHKVCGEYISNEILPFWQKLGFDPFQYGAVALTQFQLSAPSGNLLKMPLPLGGFGISRYTLDLELMQYAKKQGVEIFTNQTAREITTQENNTKAVWTDEKTPFLGKIILGTFGKRSNLDAQMQRDFFQKKSPYIGVKYHLKFDQKLQDDHVIALHNFQNGYCGISRVENDVFCMCYLTTRKNLQKFGNIPEMEKNILWKNVFLKEIFEKGDFIWEKPKVINEISFANKSTHTQGVLMAGDSAGMIAPLCGNGMAMAVHSAKLISIELLKHLKNEVSESEMFENYTKIWNKNFKFRLQWGRFLQGFFGNNFLSELLIWSGKNSKILRNFLVSHTHGKNVE